jgi:outer membrane lipoprotein-sorting protein
MEGELKISRGDDTYTYNVDSTYKSNDYYRVSLTNTVNNHEQIILRNDTGVYVLNPSINKSYKFESDWPYNNSLIYLPQIIVNDIKNDDERVIKKTKNGYKIKSKVNYANSSNLIYQWVYIDNDYNIIKVEVCDKNDQVLMEMVVSSFEKNTKFDKEYFSLKSNNENAETISTDSKIDKTIYPMYLPENTYLTNQEKIKTNDGERVILNFDGDSSFMLVEETISVPNELETNMVYGEPDFILDTVGSVTDYSVSWISNGVAYYIISNDMDTEQMMSVASSINVLAVGK